MEKEKRHANILNEMFSSGRPLTGDYLSRKMHVSRQTIVKDLGEIKSSGYDIISTSRGYIINLPSMCERIYKVVHTDEQIEDELRLFVEKGGFVKDVFVWHKIHGKIAASLNIASEKDIAEYLNKLHASRSHPLKKITSEYHYHTICAKNEQILDEIEKALSERGYLVPDEE